MFQKISRVGAHHNDKLTAPGNKSFLERVANIESSLLPKASSSKRAMVIETVENKKRVFEDDKHRVELYDIGPNPHANEILVAYLPKEKILFQADLLNLAANGSIPIAQDVTLSFDEKLRRLGLDVEKIYGRPAPVASVIYFQRFLDRLFHHRCGGVSVKADKAFQDSAVAPYQKALRYCTSLRRSMSYWERTIIIPRPRYWIRF